MMCKRAKSDDFFLFLVLEDGLSRTRDSGKVAIEIEALGKDDLEDFRDIDAVLSRTEEKGSLHEFGILARLLRNVLLFLFRKFLEGVEFGTNHEGNSGLVETTSLAVPLLDGSQSDLARQVEHEKNSGRLVTHQGQHVHEFTLTWRGAKKGAKGGNKEVKNK